MARVCELTGSKTGVGMNVSHSNRHTKRTFLPNLQEKTYQSEVLGRSVTLRISTRAIRTIDKHSGLDSFMLNVKNRHVINNFSTFATKIRKAIVAKSGVAKPAAKPTKKRASARAKKSA